MLGGEIVGGRKGRRLVAGQVVGEEVGIWVAVW